jgi:pyruvate/2-oxoglutarate dehydrogenase complex dihydrolipoamide dehydrogenase (E3) component
MGLSDFPKVYACTEVPRLRPTLTPEQQAEAQRIASILLENTREEIVAIAELLASKPDHAILGKTEFEVRDRVHKIGAKAIETALNERKKGDTKGPA